MKKLTIFTPTYNRKHLLPKLYESLKSQTDQNFCWLIIDDGSSDGTAALVEEWQQEDQIPIQYHYQQNRGMVFAHNTAHHLMATELCVCIDSDDFMPPDAVEKILSFWGQHGYPDSAGIVGLDNYSTGKIIGTLLPNIKECTFSELYVKYKIHGDKKFVHNRNVFNRYLPYTFFEGEKFPVTSYLYLLIEQKHQLLMCNEVFCTVEYREDGLSNNIINQYKESPKSFAFYRLAKMKYALNYKERFKNAVHYVSSSLMAKNQNFLAESEFKATTALATLPGMVLYLYLKNTKKTALNKNLNRSQ